MCTNKGTARLSLTGRNPRRPGHLGVRGVDNLVLFLLLLPLLGKVRRDHC